MKSLNQTKSYNILVLEDDNETRVIIHDVLSMLGINPETANWIRTTVETHQAIGPIDLFIADIEVYSGHPDGPSYPEKEAGIAAIRGLLKGKVSPEKIIVVSRFKSDTDTRRSLLEAGIDMARNTFEKPADPPTLKLAVARILGI